MRVKTVNFWMNQLSAEENNTHTKEPEDDKDLSFQIAKYYVNMETENQTKVA